MCFEIYELDSALFLTAPGLAWQGAFKVIKGKLDLLTDIYVIMVPEEEYVTLFIDM